MLLLFVYRNKQSYPELPNFPNFNGDLTDSLLWVSTPLVDPSAADTWALPGKMFNQKNRFKRGRVGVTLNVSKIVRNRGYENFQRA